MNGGREKVSEQVKGREGVNQQVQWEEGGRVKGVTTQ